MFDRIAAAAEDTTQMFQQAAQLLVDAGEFHQLFDLRLLEQRYRLGLSLEPHASLDDASAPTRDELENAYLQACREVGRLLLERGQAHEAWTYLRPAGEKALVRQWLERTVPDDEHTEELIELALYEAIDVERGFAWLLAKLGTCSALTEFEALVSRLSACDQKACVAVLVRHVNDELLLNLQEYLKQNQLTAATSGSIASILKEHPQLLADGAYHIDTSHLATTVRLARSLSDPKNLSLAIELATYGQNLAKDLQYADQPPFEDLYTTHLLLFRASLGENCNQAINYFRQKAETIPLEHYGLSAIEAYLILLERIGSSAQAMEEYARLVPTNSSLSSHAPTLLHLAEQSTQWDRYLEICKQRADAVGYAAGLLAQQVASKKS